MNEELILNGYKEYEDTCKLFHNEKKMKTKSLSHQLTSMKLVKFKSEVFHVWNE